MIDGGWRSCGRVEIDDWRTTGNLSPGNTTNIVGTRLRLGRTVQKDYERCV